MIWLRYGLLTSDLNRGLGSAVSTAAAVLHCGSSAGPGTVTMTLSRSAAASGHVEHIVMWQLLLCKGLKLFAEALQE
jgi:hypothetical protein